MLEILIKEYTDAKKDFYDHPDAFRSCSQSKEFRAISARYFKAREDLVSFGLEIRFCSSWVALEKAAYEYACWQQEAERCPHLNLQNRTFISAEIMKHLSNAEAKLLEEYQKSLIVKKPDYKGLLSLTPQEVRAALGDPHDIGAGLPIWLYGHSLEIHFHEGRVVLVYDDPDKGGNGETFRG